MKKLVAKKGMVPAAILLGASDEECQIAVDTYPCGIGKPLVHKASLGLL